MGGTWIDSGGDSGAPGNAYPCASPEPWSSNAVLCASGLIHRPAATACALPARDSAGLGAAGADGLAGAAGASSDGCATDADCSATQYCVAEPTPSCAGTMNTCIQPCQTDADCGANALCLCESYVKATGATVSMGTCVASNCHVDADCGYDFMCYADPTRVCGDRPYYFACQSWLDSCGGASDCEAPQYCTYQDGSFLCSY